MQPLVDYCHFNALIFHLVLVYNKTHANFSFLQGKKTFFSTLAIRQLLRLHNPVGKYLDGLMIPLVCNLESLLIYSKTKFQQRQARASFLFIANVACPIFSCFERDNLLQSSFPLSSFLIIKYHTEEYSRIQSDDKMLNVFVTHLLCVMWGCITYIIYEYIYTDRVFTHS